MPQRITLPVDNGMFASPDGAVANSLVKNLMPYVPEAPGAATGGALVPIFGVEDWDADVTIGHTFVANDTLYGISNTLVPSTLATIYSIDTAGSVTTEATIADLINLNAEASVAFASFEGKDIVVIQERGGDAFEFDIGGGTVTKIVDATYAGYQSDAGGVLSVTSGDGYFIFCTSRNVFISKNISEWSATSLEFNALDFATAEYKPDVNVSLKWFNGQLRVFGRHTIETWANVGGSDFPLQRISGATVEKGLGISNEASLREIDGSLIWVGNGENESPAVWMLSGGGLQKISNQYIDQLINDNGLNDGVADVGSGVSWSFGGRSYYAIRISPNSLTNPYSWYVVDLTSSRLLGRYFWTLWTTTNTADDFSQYRGNTYLDGRYRLNHEVYTDAYNGVETTLERQFTSGYLYDQSNDVYVSRIELQLKNATGLGAGSAADTAPTVTLEISDDQGRSWINLGARAIGASGATRAKAVWNRGCGASPSHRLFRFTTNTAAETVFMGIVLDIERAYY